MHLYRGIPVDTIYMVLFALFLTPLVNNHGLLASFGFTQESYVVSIFCAGLIWQVVIDWFVQILFMYLMRRDETEADLYAVERGYGHALRRGLIRNFGVNLDNIFCSRLDTVLSMSHPTLLQRISDIDAALEKRGETLDLDGFNGSQGRHNYT